MDKRDAQIAAREDADYFGVPYVVWKDEDGDWHSNRAQGGEKKSRGRLIVKPRKKKSKNPAPIPVGKWVAASKIKLNRNGTVSAKVPGSSLRKNPKRKKRR